MDLLIKKKNIYIYIYIYIYMCVCVCVCVSVLTLLIYCDMLLETFIQLKQALRFSSIFAIFFFSFSFSSSFSSSSSSSSSFYTSSLQLYQVYPYMTLPLIHFRHTHPGSHCSLVQYPVTWSQGSSFTAQWTLQFCPHPSPYRPDLHSV